MMEAPTGSKRSKRALVVECYESRRLLASDLGSIVDVQAASSGSVESVAEVSSLSTVPGIATLSSSTIPVAAATTNLANTLAIDLNSDARVTAADALMVLNALNRMQFGGEGETATGELAGEFARFDLNTDGRVTTADALLVLNALHQEATASGGIVYASSMGFSGGCACGGAGCPACSHEEPVLDAVALAPSVESE